MRLLRADAVLEMPPVPTWFAGRENIGRVLAAHVLGEPGGLRMVPTAANGQPTLAAYLRGDDGLYRAHAVQVLTCTAAGVARIVAFRDPGLFATFGLPAELPGLCGGHRLGAGQEDAVLDTAHPVVVVHRQVPYLAVVPERDRAGFPAEPGDELRVAPVLKQVAQQRQALPACPALEADGVLRVDVQ